jgi:hypothetical protein
MSTLLGFPRLDDEFIQTKPGLFFITVARELRAAGLPPGAWFDEEGDFRLKGWKLERHAWFWLATTTSHPLPRSAITHRSGFRFENDRTDRCSITSPAVFRAFVELLQTLPDEPLL